jgi:hypothetical protein
LGPVNYYSRQTGSQHSDFEAGEYPPESSGLFSASSQEYPRRNDFEQREERSGARFRGLYPFIGGESSLDQYEDGLVGYGSQDLDGDSYRGYFDQAADSPSQQISTALDKQTDELWASPVRNNGQMEEEQQIYSPVTQMNKDVR